MKNWDKMNERNLEKHRKKEQKRKASEQQKIKSTLKQMIPHFAVVLCLFVLIIIFLCCEYPYLNENSLSKDSGKCVSIEQVNSGRRKFNRLITLDNGSYYYIELNTSKHNFPYDEFKQAQSNNEEIYIKYSETYSEKLDCYEIAELYSSNQTFVSLKTTNGYRILTWVVFLVLYILLASGCLYITFLKKYAKN